MMRIRTELGTCFVVCRVAFTLSTVALLLSAAFGQKPVAELPRLQIDTTWNEPKGGKTWRAHTSEELAAALVTSAQGDMIVLDPGATYTGNFQIPGKPQSAGAGVSKDKWIYVVTANFHQKHPVGTRVNPKTDTGDMAKIVTPNTSPLFLVTGGANHWRFAGVEMTSAAPYTFFIIGSAWPYPSPLPDSFTIDRCYIHGTPTTSIAAGVQGTATNYAVIDSYISDIHAPGQDTQAFGVNNTTGPVKIVNNYLEAAGENIMFGGSGKNANSGVPSDITITNNSLFKPLSWVEHTSSKPQTMVVKNAFECKSCQRVLFDHNMIENVWAGGQLGFAIVLTVRSSQSGDFAVANDITITNNVLKNVVSGFSALAKDDVCGTPSYSDCKNAGSQTRWYIANNLILFYDPQQPGGNRNVGLAVNGGIDRIAGVKGALRDVVFQHNTMVSSATAPCWNSVFFSANDQKPPFSNLTSNIWLLDNVLCRQPSGDWGLQGKDGLTQYMGTADPSQGLDRRFYGNVMFVPGDSKAQSFPPHNLATSKNFRWADTAKGNYELAEPKWTETSDGKPAGVDFSTLPH